MNEIVLIAPYEKMIRDARSVIAKNNYKNVGVVFGDLMEGLSAASDAVNAGAKVLVSRGGTYSLIQYVSPVPVIEIQVSVLDIADTIRALLPGNEVVGIIGYPTIMNSADLLESLGKKVVRVELTRKDNVASRITDCVNQGAGVIVGDAVTCRIGRSLGYTCYLLESGEKSLQDAIDESLRLLDAINREKELVNRYRILADSVHDAVLATDEKNTVVAINAPACRIFGLPNTNIMGRPLSDLRFCGAVVDEICSGTSLAGELRQIGMSKIEISNFPILVNGCSRGSIAVFQDIAEVQSREINIRQKLVQKGFVAKYSFNTIIYRSEKMADCIAVAKKLSRYDSAVLIEGPSGVGKELFAQSIHNESRRKAAPFVAVNCAALPPSLIESVLFGYAEGAFTGGTKGGQEGVFELAHTGTLFLDEIGEMPLEFQGRLLRVIQEHEVMRIGGNANIPLDVRLICATNKNLNELVENNMFRSDLLYRLNTLNLCVPSLNERPEDIQILAETFLSRFASKYAKSAESFTPEALDFLLHYEYRGNVRELQNMIERSVIIGENDRISLKDVCAGCSLPTEKNKKQSANIIDHSDVSGFSGLSLKEVEETYIANVFVQTGESVSETCRILQINRSTLWRKLHA